MRIIEKEIIGKKTQQKCEDGIAVNDSFIAIIDGSTSKTSVRINSEMSNGRLCMETINGFIDSIPYDTSVEDFCKGATKAIQEIYTRYGFDMERLKTTPIERTTASAVIYSSHRRQVWLVGDCHCMINGMYYSNPKPDEDIIAAKRSDFIKK